MNLKIGTKVRSIDNPERQGSVVSIRHKGRGDSPLDDFLAMICWDGVDGDFAHTFTNRQFFPKVAEILT